MGTVLWIALTVAVNYLTFGLVFPASWKVYYGRHPPKDENDELMMLVYVVVSILFASVTFSGLVAQLFDVTLGGRYFTYSTIFGAVLAIMAATFIMVRRKPPPGPRGFRQTLFLGLGSGCLALVWVNATVLLGLVRSI